MGRDELRSQEGWVAAASSAHGSSGTRSERARPVGSGDARHPVKLPPRSSGGSALSFCRAGHDGDGRAAPSTCPATTRRAPPRVPRRGGWRARGPRRGAARGGGRTLRVRDRPRPRRSCGHGPLPLPPHRVAIGVRLQRRRPAPSRSTTSRSAWRRGSGTWDTRLERRGGRARRHPHGRAAAAGYHL